MSIFKQELARLTAATDKFDKLGILDQQFWFSWQGERYPLPIVKFGPSRETAAPTLLLSSGVHGLERIGVELSLSLIDTLSQRMRWDLSLNQIFEKVRLVVIPFVNPYGFVHFRRSNVNHVDLMRNAPLDAEARTPWLIGGHRLSRNLPWYRGLANELESEAKILCDRVLQESARSPVLVSLDIHSGFGVMDRLWFPFAYSNRPFPLLEEISALVDIYEENFPYHTYRIQPQSHDYMTHGDLWDYMFLEHQKQSTNIFLPLSLEMGSWNWIKKNPLQMFSKLGFFNPVKNHRRARTLRRHYGLIDFLLRSLYSERFWKEIQTKREENHRRSRGRRWYGHL